MKRSEKDHRVRITKDQINESKKLVSFWLDKRLEEKGCGALLSRHEILGVLTEEYTEIIEAAHSKLPNSNNELISELIDLAVCCLFGIACIKAKATDW